MMKKGTVCLGTIFSSCSKSDFPCHCFMFVALSCMSSRHPYTQEEGVRLQLCKDEMLSDISVRARRVGQKRLSGRLVSEARLHPGLWASSSAFLLMTSASSSLPEKSGGASLRGFLLGHLSSVGAAGSFIGTCRPPSTYSQRALNQL